MSILEMTHGMDAEQIEETERMLDWQGHVELSIDGLESAELDEDAAEAQRWLDLQGYVEFPQHDAEGSASDPQSKEAQDWAGWQGYVEQRLANCP